MANEQIVTNIVANADFSGLITDLARVTSALNNLQNQASATNKSLANQIAVMNRQFGDTLRSTGQFTTHFVTIGSDVDKFGKNLDAGRGKLRDFYGAWQGYHKQTGGLVRDLAKQQVQLQNAILQPLGRNADGMMRFAVQVPRGLDEIKSKTAIAKQELQIMNKVIQEGAGQLINWGKNTQWAGRQLTVGLTVPIAAFGKAAADAFREADEQLTRLTKVYGDVAGTSAVELGKVRKEVAATAKELASSMGASFKDTLALSADIAAAGKTGDELLGSIRETTRLSILGEVDRSEAMKATLAIQSAFKQNTDELAESINFLNAVENQTSTSLADLVEAIPKAGPVVKGLGGSIQDLALYLTAMREGGINAAEGANALKSGLASLINPTNVAVQQFKGFGIDLLGIVNSNAGNVTNTLLALQGALDTLDPLAKQQAIEQLFGKFQFARMNALFDNLGKQGSQTLKVLDLMKASSAELSDLAGRELSQVTESASGKYRRALAELRADLATVGEKFLTINTYLIKFVDKIVDFANNLPGPIKAILGFLGGITAIAGPLIMLTGVLGNFFGYVIKGVSHFKSLFKGGEGWKLLTPEILAADKAGNLVEQTFYSDAKAAAVLNQALRDLTAQYDALAVRAQSGAISVNPVLTNISAQAQAQGLSRVVDKNHPLVGDYGTRSSGHMVPRKVDQPRTIFGLVPTSTPVNAAIGENPMIYADSDMPKISGLTSIPSTRTINGVKQTVDVSTGIVASEAARHHAYTASLAMQSQAELKALKTTIATTGTVSKEFMDTFDDILPITSRITTNAARQSAMIVAELQEGKITAAIARQRIIDLNLAIERELGAAVTAYAGTAGRTVNLMNVPGSNQPVQTSTGKSNMREMFKTRTGGIFNRIAEALGVRTSGAGYNIETTKLRRYNTGGSVEAFGSNKTVVSGPTSINYDDRLGSIPLGGYVLNQGASLDPANQDLVKLAPYTFNSGGNITAALTPGEVVFGPNIHNIPGLPEALDAANYGLNIGGRVHAAKNNYGARIIPQRVRTLFSTDKKAYRKSIRDLVNDKNISRSDKTRNRDIAEVGSYGGHVWATRTSTANAMIDDYLMSLPVKDRKKVAEIIETFGAGLKQGGGGNGVNKARDPFFIEQGHLTGALDDLLTKKYGLPTINPNIRTHKTHLTRAEMRGLKRYVSKYVVDYTATSNLKANHGTLSVAEFIKNEMGRTGKYNDLFRKSGVPSLSWKALEKQIDREIRKSLVGKSQLKIGDEKGDIQLDSFIPLIDKQIIEAGGSKESLDRLKLNTELRSVKKAKFNSGGAIPGFWPGGSIGWAAKAASNTSRSKPYVRPGTVKVPEGKQNSLTKSMVMRALGVTYGKNDDNPGWGAKALSIGMGSKLFGKTGLLPNTQNLMYANLVDQLAEAKPYGYYKAKDGSLLKGIEVDAIDDIVRAAASKTLSTGGKKLSAIDRKILREKFAWDTKGTTPATSYVRKAIFGYKNGGHIGGGPISRARRNYGQRVDFTGNIGIGPKNSATAYSPGHMPDEDEAVSNTQGSFVAGMGLQTAGYMASQSENEAVRGASMPLMLAGTAMQFAPMMKPITTAMKSVTTFKGLLTGLGSIAARVGLALRTAFTFLTGPIGITIGLLTVGAKLLLDWKKRSEEAGKANRLAFGGTAESFASVGIKNYKNLSDRMDDYLKKQELLKAKTLSSYNSFTKAKGPTGLTLTIDQLDKAVENAKKNQKDYVEAFNNIDQSRVTEYAASLKAQFLAMGMSSSDATNQIYAIIKASDKAGKALEALSSKAFRSMTDVQSGISYMSKAIIKALDPDIFNAEEIASGLDTLLNSLIKYQDGLIGTVGKNKEVLDLTDALALAIGKIIKVKGSATQLDEDQLAELKKQNVVYGSILGKNENLRSVTAKILMYQAGLGEMVDLSLMGATEAVQFAKNLKVVQDVMNSITEDTALAQRKNGTTEANPLMPLSLIIKQAELANNKAQESLKKMKKADDEYYDNKIKRINEVIDKVNDEANARLKLLQAEQDRVDYNDELRKAKLAYEQAIASGDMVEAANSQANIQKLVEDRQRAITIQNIQDRRDDEIKKLQAEIDSLQKEKDDINKGFDSATAKAAETSANLAQLQAYRDEIESIALRNRGKDKMDPTDSKRIMVIINEMQKAGGVLKKAADDIVTNNAPPKSTSADSAKAGAGKTLSQNIVDSLNKELNARGGSNTVFKNAVEKFDQAVREFAGKTSANAPTDAEKNIVPWYSAPGGVNPGRDFSYLHFNVGKKAYVIKVDSTDGWDEMYNKAKELGATKLKWNKVRIKDYTEADVDSSGDIKLASGGQVKHFEPGGNVTGPGTGTSDSIPAMLSNGEYVIKASSVAKYGTGFMDHLNAGRFADGGMVQKFANGGMPNVFGKGMDWFGKTLFSSANSVIKNVLGFDITKPMSKKSNMEKLSMMLLPIGGEGAVAKAAPAASKELSNFFLHRSEDLGSIAQDLIFSTHANNGERVIEGWSQLMHSPSKPSELFSLGNQGGPRSTRDLLALSLMLGAKEGGVGRSGINLTGSADRSPYAESLVSMFNKKGLARTVGLPAKEEASVGETQTEALTWMFNQLNRYNTTARLRGLDGAIQVPNSALDISRSGLSMLMKGQYNRDSFLELLNGFRETMKGQKGFANGGLVQKFGKGGLSSAPHEMGMQWGGGKKKDGWLQRYANNLTAAGQARAELVGRSKWTAWTAGLVNDPLGFNGLIRKLAGTDDNGSALAAALFFTNFSGLGIGTKLGQAGKTAGVFPDNIFGQSNSAIKKAMEGIYQRKNIELDGSLYPTYTLGDQDKRFAFQGLNEDLSGLAKNGVEVVPVTPEGILSAALKMSPDNKSIKSMLNNFKKNNISDTELAFLDSIAASIGISKKGKELANINTDGYAMLLSALSGNKGAQSIVGAKTEAFHKIIAKNKQYSEIAAKGGSATKNIDDLDPSQLTMIHSTKFPVMRDKYGNILLNAYGHHNLYNPDVTKRVPRASLHLTAEDTVKGDHLSGSWSNEETKIVTSLEDLIKDNNLPYNLHGADTWWMLNPGQALKISNGVAIRTSKNQMQYAADLVKRGIIKAGDEAPLVASDIANKDVLQIFKESYTQKDRDFILKAMIENGRAGFKMEDVVGKENQLLEIIALQNAKRMINIKTPHTSLAGESLSDADLMKKISNFALNNKISNTLHNSTFPSNSEGLMHMRNYFNERIFGRGSTNPFATGTPIDQLLKGRGGAADSIEAIRMIIRYGDSETGIKRLIREYGTGAATGGYLKNGKLMQSLANGGLVNIPKFDDGINMVPADMLAMIHKNEAVVPANMNPFNPNANNATMGGSTVYNISPVINAAPGMDEKLVADLAARQVMKALDTNNTVSNLRVGTTKVITNMRG